MNATETTSQDPSLSDSILGKLLDRFEGRVESVEVRHVVGGVTISSLVRLNNSGADQ